MRRAIGVAFHCDRRNGDDRRSSEPFLQSVIFRLAFRQSEAPAIIVNHDGDVIGIVERRRGAIECRIVEVPFRRRQPPDQLGKIPPVFVVAGPSALCGEIELIPPLQFSLRRQRRLAGRLIADQIAAHRDEAITALRPKRRDDVRGPRAPIKAAENGLLDFERVHERDRIDGDNDC